MRPAPGFDYLEYSQALISVYSRFMRILYTIFLGLIAGLMITASVFLTIDGNLAKLTGWYRVTPGMPLFTNEHSSQLSQVSWMRIADLHDTIECEKDSNGTWWIIKPFRDKLDPQVATYILNFAQNAHIIDTLTINDETRKSMRDFGVESDPCSITLKRAAGNNEHTTVARFTLGKKAPWLADLGDGKNVGPTTYLRTKFYGDDDRVHVVSGNITPLFAGGLKNLRDHMPLRFDPNALVGITIRRQGEQPINLKRENKDSQWILHTVNNSSVAEQENAAKLMVMLCQLQALSVKNASEVKLPKEPQCTIELSVQGEKTPRVLKIYPPEQLSGTHGSATARSYSYATINDRDVVFRLQAEPKIRRKGGFSSIVNGVFSLPVLPAETMAECRGLNETYTADLPLSLEQLRSRKLATFDERDVESVLIRSRHSRFPVRLCLIPGIRESNVQDAWTVEAQGEEPAEAETDIVRSFLRNFRTIPVEGIVADLPFADTPEDKARRAELMKKYGLFSPDYRIFITPRSCGYRSSIYGVDLPLIKDRDVKIFAISHYEDPESGETMRVAMMEGSHTIFRVSPRLTRTFAMQLNAWKSRNLVGFHIAELKRFTLDYQEASLVLDYDSMAETWSGKLGGADVTANINPHRALNCVDRLRKLKVREWLDPYDADALEKLSTPVFRVKIELESVDHSQVEAIVVDTEELGHDRMTESGAEYRQDGAGAALQEDSDLDRQFRDLALLSRPTVETSYTIEIAPVNNTDDKPMFYGRIRETGQLFLMKFEDAQSIGSSPLEDNVHVLPDAQ